MPNPIIVVEACSCRPPCPLPLHKSLFVRETHGCTVPHPDAHLVSQRRVRHALHAVTEAHAHQLALCAQRVQLHLVHQRPHAARGKQVLNLRRGPRITRSVGLPRLAFPAHVLQQVSRISAALARRKAQGG